MTLQEFDDFVARLSQHDWHYARSDDPNVYAQGQRAFQTLSRQASTSPEAVAVFKAYQAYSHYPAGITVEELREVILKNRAYIAAMEND